MKAEHLSLALGMATVLVCRSAIAQEPVTIKNVEYRSGYPGEPKQFRGSLRFSDAEITLIRAGTPRIQIDAKSVTYIAARAKARMRTQTSDTGAMVAAIAFGPAALFFHKRERHLLSIEYRDGGGDNRILLLDIHDHSALAVKKMLDERLGLARDYYRAKDAEEEEEKRAAESAATPAGSWTATKNVMAGDSQYSRELLEKGIYDILIFERYIGFRPAGQSWAKYRIPIRVTRRDPRKRDYFAPEMRSGRLFGFIADGQRYLFY